MKTISVVIPVFREQAGIHDCLRRLCALEGIRDAEVILVDGDGGSTLDVIPESIPGAAATDLTIRKICCESGRGVQLNRGAAEAEGRGLVFLHVDTVLPRDALPAVAKALRVWEAGAFSIRIRTDNPLVKVISLFGTLRSRLSRTPYGDQVQFIRKSTFGRIGGFPEKPLMEDVGLMDRLRRAHIPIRILPQRVVTSDRRWRSNGFVYQSLLNLLLMARYRMGATPEELYRWYRPQSEIGPATRPPLPWARRLCRRRHDGEQARPPIPLHESPADTVAER